MDEAAVVPTLPAATDHRVVPLWILIARACLLVFVLFWLFKGVDATFRARLPKMFDYHMDMTTMPPNDHELVDWGRRQPGILYFRTIRLPHEMIVRACSRENPASFPIPNTLLATEMGKRGYLGKAKYVSIDLTPYGQLCNLLVKQAIMLGVGLCGIFLARRRGEPIPPPFAAPVRSAVVPGILGGLVIIGIGAVVTTLWPETPALMGAGFPRGARIFLYLAGTIGAGVSEEVLYRGYIFGSFAGAGDRRVGVGMVLSAYLFARVHDWNTIALIRIILGGLLLAWLYHTRKTLAASILAHSLNNAWYSRFFLVSW